MRNSTSSRLQLFDNTQFGAAASRIRDYFRAIRRYRLAIDQLDLRAPFFYGSHAGWRNHVCRKLLEVLLDEPIFEAVKGDNCQSPAGTKKINGDGHNLPDRIKLLVDGDA